MEMEEFKARVSAASDGELGALVDAYQSTLAVLLIQAKGVQTLQEIALAETKRRIAAKAAAVAEADLARGKYGCN